MTRTGLIALLVLFSLTFTGCGDDDDSGGTGGTGGAGGSGGEAADSGVDAADDAAQADTGGGETGGCPPGTFCSVPPAYTGIEDGYLCASLEDAQPPPCANQEECEAGECKDGHCIQECQLPDCPAGYECIAYVSKWLCALVDTGEPAGCEFQDDCDIGHCEGPEGLANRKCVQRCEPEGGAPEKVSVTGRVTVFAPTTATDVQADPVEGAEVCIHENNTVACASSGADGSFTLTDVAIQQEVMLTVTKDGYEPSATQIFVGVNDMEVALPVPMLTEDAVKEAEDTTGITLDETKGSIIASVGISELVPDAGAGFVYTSLEGVTASLDPASGDGPFYADADGKIDLSLQATSELGGLSFLNVEPGDYTLSFDHSTMVCSGAYATVIAGHVTMNVGGFCQASN
jgi:hypothetical protein